MDNIAPSILRQRLLIEGYYTVEVDESKVGSFLTGLADHLGLRYYGKPVVHTPDGIGKVENEGYDAFLSLADSGISLYVWTTAKFYACVLFTCREFDAQRAVAFVKESFASSRIVSESF
jgi:S-adenosylmethionine/arginine decarboxylase-like enzyme